MQKVYFIELIIHSIPEMALYAILACVLAKEKIYPKRIALTSILMTTAIYFIRMLPVEFGVHTLLALFLIIFLNIKINKIDKITSIQVSILSFIVMYIIEIITVLVLNFGFKIDFEVAFLNPVYKSVLGIPPLILYGIVIIVIKKLIIKYNYKIKLSEKIAEKKED